MNRFSVGLTVGLVALVAGCGDAGPNEFAESYTKALDSLQDVESVKGDDPTRNADNFAALMDKAAARLRELDPPDKAQDELDALVQEIEATANAMRDATSAWESGNRDAIRETEATFNAHMRRIGDREQDLQTAVLN
jgi:hypothetical protein